MKNLKTFQEMMLERILKMQNNQIKTQVKEIFKSIQGEGPYVGYEQVFIRFCKCNLSCNYCDTDYFATKDCKDYSAKELIEEIDKLNINNIHSISLTGGEPLLDIKFLKEFLPLTDKKIYLETNGTLARELSEIITYIDVISMDIKLPSATKMKPLTQKHKKFIEVCTKNNKGVFLKIVIDETISDTEIKECIKLAKADNLLIVLQPLMINDCMKMNSIDLMIVFGKFTQKYNNVRLIPQVHKFINII